MKHPVIAFLMKNQVLIALLVIGIVWLLFQLREIILAFFISYIIMAALYPLVIWLTKKGIPRTVSVTGVFVTTLLLLILLIFPLIPFFVEQIQMFVVRFPLYLRELSPLFGFDINVRQLQGVLSDPVGTFGESAITFSARIFGGFFLGVTIFVVSFYLLLEHDNMNHRFLKLFPKVNREEVAMVLSRVEEKLGMWLRGQLVLSVTVGVLTWISLTLLGFDYALPLALLAGLLEILPTIGPIIAAVPAVIIALTVSPTLALITVGVYVAIQLLENHVLVPRIMSKAVGLNPLVVLLGIIVGAHLLGVAGALLSVPFISLITVIVNTLQTYRAPVAAK